MFEQETGLSLLQGEAARLIPVGSEKSLERRSTSVFLSTLSVVEKFAGAMLATVGRKLGTRTVIQCFTEVVLPQENGKQDRPDGLIVIKNGKRLWTALVEAKVGNAVLDAEQVQKYLVIAKQNNIDAVITISNQFAAFPSHHPVKIPKNALRSVELFHWSWTSILTQAIYQLDIEQDIDPEQRYILSEFQRHFQHPSSGVKAFDSMNKEWREVCVQVKNGGKLLRSSMEVQNTIGAWHQEQRDISLRLTRELKAPVQLKLKEAHKKNPETRLKEDAAKLADHNLLESDFYIPDAASDLTLIADLRRRTISCKMELLSPTDKKSAKARVNWLLRQLHKSSDPKINIVARWPGRTKDTSATLADLRENPAAIQCENSNMVPHRFQVTLVRDLAGRFSGAKTFLDGVNEAVIDFYREAGEHLKQWVPPAPKLPSQAIESSEEHSSST